MKSAYHNAATQLWTVNRSVVPRYVDWADGRYERVLTVSVETDEETGKPCFGLSLRDLGDGRGGPDELIAAYPLTRQDMVMDDAMSLATCYGLRLRFASVRMGWLWWDGCNGPAATPPLDIASEF